MCLDFWLYLVTIFLKKDYFVFQKIPSQNNFFHPIEIFFQTFYPMAILFFLLFILWQPKIEAQKYEIGTPMKTCP